MNNQRKEIGEQQFLTLFCLTCATTYPPQDERVEGSRCNASIPVLICKASHRVNADDNSIAGAYCGYKSGPDEKRCTLILQISDMTGCCQGILRIKRFGEGVTRNDE